MTTDQIKKFTPKIATHWTEAEAEETYQSIKEEAVALNEEEITQKVQELMAEANKWCKRMIHDPSMQDSRDRMYGRWVSEDSEMAVIWSRMV